jgi:hypothetical protein
MNTADVAKTAVRTHDVMHSERRLGHIGGVHADLVVAGVEVQLGEETGAVQLVEKFVDHLDGKRVLDDDGIEGELVDAKTPCAVGLLDQQNQRGKRRSAAPDQPLGQHGGALAQPPALTPEPG